jgi:flagellar M-ring protein FliF
MLARTLGPGKAQVKISADLNVDEATQERLQYDRQGTALREREETEQLEGGQAAGGAGAGAGANIAGGGAAGAGGQSNYEKNANETDYGVGKTVTRTRIAPGEVERLDVALMIDQTVPRPAVAGLRQTVSSAAGIQTDRGDTLSVAQLAFAKLPAAEEPKGSPIPPFVVGPAKWVGLGLAALLFLFFVTRALRKREDSPLGPEPTWLREIDAPRPLAELQAAAGVGAPTVTEGTLTHSRAVVENLVAQEPEKVAAQVRNWISEEDA